MASGTKVALYDKTATLAGVATVLARHTDIQFVQNWQANDGVSPDVVLYDATAADLGDVVTAVRHLQGVRLVGLDAARALAFTWTAHEDTVVTITDLAAVIVEEAPARTTNPRSH